MAHVAQAHERGIKVRSQGCSIRSSGLTLFSRPTQAQYWDTPGVGIYLPMKRCWKLTLRALEPVARP